MSKFDELLNKKLPSAVMEDVDDPMNVADDVENDINAIDLDGLDDDEVDDIDEDELAAIDDDDEDDPCAGEEDLTPDEEVEADKTMALVATPVMLQKELMDESASETFFNEFTGIVTEGFLLESDIDMFLEGSADELMTEGKRFASKTKVMFSEKVRKKQLFEVGVQASARAHNDPIYWRLQKVYKLERQYKAILRQKYRGEALRRVKAYIKRLKSSSSSILHKIGDKITGSGKED